MNQYNVALSVFRAEYRIYAVLVFCFCWQRSAKHNWLTIGKQRSGNHLRQNNFLFCCVKTGIGATCCRVWCDIVSRRLLDTVKMRESTQDFIIF
jgi:hypothetical protein